MYIYLRNINSYVAVRVWEGVGRVGVGKEKREKKGKFWGEGRSLDFKVTLTII